MSRLIAALAVANAELPELTPEMARQNFLDLAAARGGLTPSDEKILRRYPLPDRGQVPA